MYQLMMMLSLFPQQSQVLTQKSNIACTWPNVCTAEKVAPATQSLTPITTCQWPNTCTAEAATPITTCQWPNTCAI